MTQIKKPMDHQVFGGVSRGNKNLVMSFILDLLDSSDVVVVLPQLLLVAQAVIPVTQLLVSGRREGLDEAGATTRHACEIQCKETRQSSFFTDTLKSQQDPIGFDLPTVL